MAIQTDVAASRLEISDGDSHWEPSGVERVWMTHRMTHRADVAHHRSVGWTIRMARTTPLTDPR